MAQGPFGRIELFEDFTGAEVPIAGTVAAPIQFNQFKLVGDLAETDTGLVTLAKANGWARISNNNEDGKGAAVATETIFRADVNGPLVAECRLELQALTARNVFFGFSGTIADDVAIVSEGSTTTYTLTAAHQAGFMFDSQLTDNTHWHAVYKGGTATSSTTSPDNSFTDDTITAAQSQLLRIEVDPDGTVRWYIDGVLRRTTAGALDTDTLVGVLVGAWGTTTTAADVDVDYLAVRANRDWTV